MVSGTEPTWPKCQNMLFFFLTWKETHTNTDGERTAVETSGWELICGRAAARSVTPFNSIPFSYVEIIFRHLSSVLCSWIAFGKLCKTLPLQAWRRMKRVTLQPHQTQKDQFVQDVWSLNPRIIQVKKSIYKGLGPSGILFLFQHQWYNSISRVLGALWDKPRYAQPITQEYVCFVCMYI